jgi:very-short-patch-repair endonuclease
MKFRRQQVIDGFIVDFYCAEYRLILEIDGAVHMDPIRNEQDSERTAHLTAGGFKVIRLPNRNVSREALVRLLHPFSTRAPSPGRERGTGGEV